MCFLCSAGAPGVGEAVMSTAGITAMFYFDKYADKIKNNIRKLHEKKN